MSKHIRIINYLFIGIVALYAGSVLSYILSIYAFFDPGEITLNAIFLNTNLSGMLYLVGVIKNITLFLCLSALLFFIVLLLISKLKFRDNGWLFISTLLMIFIALFELYSFLEYDYELIKILFVDNIESLSNVDLIKNKISSLSSLIPIHFFAIITIFYMFIIKPFTKK